MLEPLPVRDRDVNKPQSDPPVVIDQPLAMDDPARLLLIGSHTAKLQPNISDVHG